MGCSRPAASATRPGLRTSPELRAGLLEALAPFRTAGGGYRLENEWHTLVATA